MPRSDEEFRTSVADAARRPKLFQQLWERYEGHAIPTILPNLLVREFGVLPQSGDSVAQTFKDTVEFAGLLPNGILMVQPATAASREEVSSQPHLGSAPTPGPGARSVPSDAAQRYIVALDARGRFATIELPLPVRQRDLTALENWLSFMRPLAEEAELDGN